MKIAHLGLTAILLASPSAPAQLRQQGPKLVGCYRNTKPFLGDSAAISADGNTAIVGGPFDDSLVGAAWVFARVGGVWAQQGAKLVGSGANGSRGAEQGSSVAISADGNTVVVGGPWDGDGVGAAWVFSRTGGTWAQMGSKLVGSGATGSIKAMQGTSVAISADGTTVAVGGPDDDSWAGAVWIWVRQGDEWVAQGPKLVGTGAAATGARQGASVALSADGDTAIVGGPNNWAGGQRAGGAWVFTRSAGVWTQQGGVLYGVGAVGDPKEGTSVAISADGNTAILGGSGDNGNLGAAWVFTRTAGIWTQEDGKLVGTGAIGAARQGASVSLSADGNMAVVAGYDDDARAGALWIWTRTGGNWAQQGAKLVGSGAVGAAAQGESVALSADGGTLIAGGPYDENGAGAAWPWARSGAEWSQQGSKLVGSGVARVASQGRSVALSADGNTAILGSPYGPEDSGACVWARTGGVWEQQGGILIGSSAVGSSNQGESVSISADGNTAIVGGRDEDTKTAVAWVWMRSGAAWTQQGSKLVGGGAAGSSPTGAAVALSGDGNTAFVGGYEANSLAGGAWVWVRTGDIWTQQGEMLVGSGSAGNIARQGSAVALSEDGDTAILGGFYDDGGVGAAWVFTRSGGVWTQQGAKLVGTGAETPAAQGSAVALSGDGNTAIVGGPTQDTWYDAVGAAWVFVRTGGSWAQQGEKLVGPGATGLSLQGTSVALSRDGGAAIVGGPADADGAGAAWVWKRAGDVWTPHGTKLVGTGSDTPARQGESVALSGDGSTAIVGGPNDTTGGNTAGAAWAFSTGQSFYPLSPCRLLDTRDPAGPLGGPALAADGSRLFTMTGVCGVPADARALSANVTVTQTTAAGGLTLHPGDQATPTASTISFGAGLTRANNAMLLVADDGSGTVNVVNRSSGPLHLVVDVNGYFR